MELHSWQVDNSATSRVDVHRCEEADRIYGRRYRSGGLGVEEYIILEGVGVVECIIVSVGVGMWGTWSSRMEKWGMG